jgi:HSP20 family molecular chaperone IbpA
MTRTGIFSSPFLLGFDRIERILERASKAAQDSYPPYNIQHAGENRLRISIAVAGFAPEDLSVSQEDDLLVVRGRREETQDTTFLHRGIAGRQFQRTFVLADGIEVLSAEAKNGLLTIELERNEPEKVVRSITIRSGEVQPHAGNVAEKS